MAQVVALRQPRSTTMVPLLDAYRTALADGYNSTVSTGRFDKSTAQMMAGFLLAATVALRTIGDEPWASRFEASAHRILADWRQYDHEIPALCADLDNR